MRTRLDLQVLSGAIRAQMKEFSKSLVPVQTGLGLLFLCFLSDLSFKSLLRVSGTHMVVLLLPLSLCFKTLSLLMLSLPLSLSL